MTAANLCYAQSGGVTAVINVSAAAVLDAADADPRIGKVYAARNGILGILHEDLIETWRENKTARARLAQTPGGAFGSCRVKLPPPRDNPELYRRLFAVCREWNIRYFLYNGGNDSADTALKLSAAAKEFGFPLATVGVPKTIDNDLAASDSCPGFGSAAKYIAVGIAEAALDVASMARTSTKVFVLEVMGRNAGWLAAAAALSGREELLVLPPEAPFRRDHFVAALRRRVQQYGFAVVAVSEGVRDLRGKFLAAAKTADAFAHRQLGGVAPHIAAIVQNAGFKCHWGVADYLQRAARHLASQTDVAHADALGRAAVRLAAAGENAVMPVIRRLSDSPYRWKVATARLKNIANRERKLPANFYDRETYRITPACRRYLAPLICGEEYPAYGKDGLPLYAGLKNIGARKKLPPWEGTI
ncbi:MAG: 6-phosphofructokinase [Gammaproteobacteria bacterium]